MTDDLRLRLLTLQHAIEPLLHLAADAEECALPGTTREGLLRARSKLRSLQIAFSKSRKAK